MSLFLAWVVPAFLALLAEGSLGAWAFTIGVFVPVAMLLFDGYRLKFLRRGKGSALPQAQGRQPRSVRDGSFYAFDG